MNRDLPGLIDAFAGLNALVIGEAMLDSYLEGSATRLCPEAPVPVVALAGRTDAPGGAANVAANLTALGASATILSVTGDDGEGLALRRALAARGVITNHLRASARRRTLSKQRVVADGQVIVRFDQGSTEPLAGEDEGWLLDCLETLFPHCDAVLISDYGYGVLTPRVIELLAQLQARTPRLIAVDAKDLRRYREVGVTVAKPNYAEALQLLGERGHDGARARTGQIAAAAGRLLDLTNAQIAAVTLDRDGALVLERGLPPYRTYARGAQHARPAGAGDTFVSAFALALAAGATTPAAAEVGSAAAAVVVEKDGTAVCAAIELRERVHGDEKYAASAVRLGARLALHRERGRRIVFTNGCFDILHSGHITYLNRAKALGDVLVVGVNSDASVRRLKGDQRPINSLDDRVQVLAAMSCVDHIVAFDEDTPVELIRAVRPDVFVKGGDYSRETLPEASVVEEMGGTVQILPYVADRSTTGIIERIRVARETGAAR
jgi:D-beta-D-heptose 7-phosphate kinase / D-beta-D-heptose 1-phosphate adenosyltransferase